MAQMRTVAAALCLALAVSGQAKADSTSACGAVLCLAGEMIGHGGGSACTGYMASYFSIISWRHGHMDLVATAANRMNFLNQCSTQDSAVKVAVNDKYGTQQSAP
ncbi:TrbM/KikA/MpfK family conjugal transfer protein [Caballeronia sp. TF1N1]|uniref:TrbM/KikA/MpfK family conjugal transfer protein n=1 Tax=Caballeronia sp. TF1N1 TaxID=2878153 RepID=UPI001FD48740|nr:TrbM/KikA/MpfK family conjugal transfer protein [Caballeronia sp. TF1N1]